MKRYEAIVFDFDMTLADSSRVIVDLLNDCAEYFGYKRMAYEQTLPVIGNTHEIMLSYVTGEKDPKKLLVMRDYYRGLCRSEMPQRTTFFPGVDECLAEIHGKGIKIGILSQKLRDVLMASLVKYDLAHYFDVVIGCEDVPFHKPDPSGLYKAMEALNVSASGMMYVGDSLVDECVASNAGVDFSAMLLGSTACEQFRQDFAQRFYTSLKGLQEDVARIYSNMSIVH